MAASPRQMKFVNLHGHSTFSYGDGTGTPEQHVARAASLGYTALALTEHGNTSSHFQLEKHALKAGIKPIFGLEAYTGAVDKEHRQQLKYHLTILAETVDGYRSLNRIVTQSWRDHHYHPTVSGANLAGNTEGILVLSGCTGSLLACSLVGGKGFPDPGGGQASFDAVAPIIEWFKATFGDSYFLEVQPFWELENTNRINPAYETLSRIFDVPLAVTCDVHYPMPGDSVMQAVLHAVHRGKHSVDDAMREWNYQVLMTLPESDKDIGERLMKTGLSREAAWGAICNTAWIAERCNVTLPKAERLRYPITQEDLKPWSLYQLPKTSCSRFAFACAPISLWTTNGKLSAS